ncbi:WxcM-like domain-containing protein [Candidatus Woesearchaeota archaeon]|nr:WxcM-like domain-containing protein [Candidatus Woesearchaeota archaeon]
MFDCRFPLVEGFDVKFMYCSRIFERYNVSGQHYHRAKEEILIPMKGRFDIFLEDVKTKVQEHFSLDAIDNKAIYIPTGVSHKVVLLDEEGVFVVLASTNSEVEDEIPYEVR